MFFTNAVVAAKYVKAGLGGQALDIKEDDRTRDR
jgi:hypothetical protein